MGPAAVGKGVETKLIPYSWQRPRGLGSPSIYEPVLSPHSSDIHLYALCWFSNYNACANEAARDVASFTSEPACLSGCVVRAARPWHTRTLLRQGHGSGVCPGAGLGEVLPYSGLHGVLLAHRAPSWSLGAVCWGSSQSFPICPLSPLCHLVARCPATASVSPSSEDTL